ncbi:MAG: hypothetical protein SFT81_03475 [Candidatus Caenarcaniphilales bacterium]|nr:hypothetical protein [Candidatus Caenarcaniphilales bacterium]
MKSSALIVSLMIAITAHVYMLAAEYPPEVDPSEMSPQERAMIQNVLQEKILPVNEISSASHASNQKTSQNQLPAQAIQLTPEEMQDLKSGKITLQHLLTQKQSIELPIETNTAPQTIDGQFGFMPPTQKVEAAYPSLLDSALAGGDSLQEPLHSAPNQQNTSLRTDPDPYTLPIDAQSKQAIALSARDLELLQSGKISLEDLINTRQVVDLDSSQIPAGAKVISSQNFSSNSQIQNPSYSDQQEEIVPNPPKQPLTLKAPRSEAITPLKVEVLPAISKTLPVGKVFQAHFPKAAPLPNGYQTRRYLPPAAPKSPVHPIAVPISSHSEPSPLSLTPLDTFAAVPSSAIPIKLEALPIVTLPIASVDPESQSWRLPPTLPSQAPTYEPAPLTARSIPSTCQMSAPYIPSPNTLYAPVPVFYPQVYSPYSTSWISRSPVFMTDSPAGQVPIYSTHGRVNYPPGTPLPWYSDTPNGAH